MLIAHDSDTGFYDSIPDFMMERGGNIYGHLIEQIDLDMASGLEIWQLRRQVEEMVTEIMIRQNFVMGSSEYNSIVGQIVSNIHAFAVV